MRKQLIICSLAALPFAAHAQTIQEPDWVSKPTFDQLYHAYPALAAEMGIGGRAVIACRVSALGVLEACEVVDETPKGIGFGFAGLSMSEYFRMRPLTVNGRGVPGGDVRIPLRFQIPARRSENPAASTPPNALARAKQLVDLSGVATEVRERLEAEQSAFERKSKPGVETGVREAGEQALRAARDRAVPKTVDLMARFYASRLSIEDLDALIDFYQSEPGRALVAQRLNIIKAYMRAGTIHSVWTANDARDELCRNRDCDVESALGNFEDRLDWVEEPSAATIRRQAPALPAFLRMAGGAHLACGIGAFNRLDHCKVEVEAPQGLGFGRAALGLAGYYRVSTTFLALAGPDAKVGLTVRFHAEPRQREATAPKVDARRLALAKAMLAPRDDSAQMALSIDRALTQLRNAPSQAGDGAKEDQLEDVVRRSSEKRLPQTLAIVAAEVATLFSEAELNGIVAFQKTPASRALNIAEHERNETGVPGWFAVEEETLADARAVFCKSQDCTPPRPRSAGF